MNSALLPLLYIVVGYLLAILTIYATAICTKRLSLGQSLLPCLRKPTDASPSGYRSNYRGHTP